MPYVENMQADEQKTDPNVVPQGAVSPTGGGSGAVRLSPSSSVPPVGGSGTNSGAGIGNAATPSAGGQFASLQNYLSANQGQAQPLADKITPGINAQYGNLDAQNNATIAGINSQVTNAPGYSANNPDVIAAASANPVSFTGDPNNVKQFQSLLNNTYSGPASAEGTSDFANQQSAINQAIATGTANTTTEAGRQNLLQQNEATPTTGVTALNSAILSQDPNALSSIENAYKPFGNLLTNLSAGAQGVDTTISNEQANAASTSAAANKAIADQVSGLNAGVQGELNTVDAQNQKTIDMYNSLIDTLSHGGQSLTPDQMAALGLTADQGQALAVQGNLADTSQYMTGHNFGAPSAVQDINNTAYLQQMTAPVAPTVNQVATPQQFQTLMALLALNNGQTPTGALLDPTQASQAGTYVAPTLNGTFDYKTALANATATAQQERADAQAQADQLTAAANAAHDASKSHTFGGNLLKALGTGATYLANPLATVPAQTTAAKKLATKV